MGLKICFSHRLRGPCGLEDHTFSASTGIFSLFTDSEVSLTSSPTLSSIQACTLPPFLPGVCFHLDLPGFFVYNCAFSPIFNLLFTMHVLGSERRSVRAIHVSILAFHTVSDALLSPSAQASRPPASPNSLSGLCIHATVPGFYRGSGDLNSGPYGTDPSPAFLFLAYQLHCSVCSPHHWSPQGHSVTD